MTFFTPFVCATVGWFISFFRIQNIELRMFACPVPKMSQVMTKWRRRASHLVRFTLWHSGCRATTEEDRETLLRTFTRATKFWAGCKKLINQSQRKCNRALISPWKQAWLKHKHKLKDTKFPFPLLPLMLAFPYVQWKQNLPASIR